MAMTALAQESNGFPGSPNDTFVNRLAVRSRGEVSIVDVEDVDWIDALGNSIRIHAAETVRTTRMLLGDLEGRLDPAHFVRVHRSTIVHMCRIRGVEVKQQGDYTIILKSGQRISVGRKYRKLVKSWLEALR